ncbi:MAG TPA: phage major capsid protein [Candidatus Paceibacterota bacterium]|nr:phage major capsid protein [Candidatus Paceibacterota bacterium]
METRKSKITTHGRNADLQTSSLNEETREIEVVFGSEYPVLRYDWGRDEYFSERLSFDPAHVNMERMDGGVAPVLDNHDSFRGASGTLGVVRSAELNGDHGTAVLRFADTDDVENTWRKVKDGIIRSVSVGYRVSEYSDTGERDENGYPIRLATDWTPMEVSIAPIPADPTSVARKDDIEKYEVRIVGEDKPEPKKPTPNPKAEEVRNAIKSRQRDAGNKSKLYKMATLKDLQASRKAFEDEFANLDGLSERDETQETRYNELIEKIGELNTSIEREEKAAQIRAARAAAGEAADTGESKEKEKMAKRFSFSQAIRSVISRESVDGVAKEMRDHALSNGHPGGGDIIIPSDFVRAGSADDFQASSGDGSGYVATEVGSFIEGLMMPLMVEDWGTQVFQNQTANLKFPRESVNADATQEGEVDAGAASGAELDELTLSPVRFHNDTKYSKQLLLQGGASVESDIAGMLRRGHERRLLKYIFATALTNAGNDIAAGDTADYDAIANSLINAVLEDEGLTDNCRFVMSPSTHEYFQSAVSVTGISQLLNENTRTLKGGYNYHATPYMADASSGVGQILFGDWSNAVLAYFGSIDIVVDPFSSKDTAQVELAMNRWADFDLRQVNGWAKEDGVTVS